MSITEVHFCRCLQFLPCVSCPTLSAFFHQVSHFVFIYFADSLLVLFVISTHQELCSLYVLPPPRLGGQYLSVCPTVLLPSAPSGSHGSTFAPVTLTPDGRRGVIQRSSQQREAAGTEYRSGPRLLHFLDLSLEPETDNLPNTGSDITVRTTRCPGLNIIVGRLQ